MNKMILTCISKIPTHRVNVFISSAMIKENETDWLYVRKRIKTKLESCPYLSPFIIEESTSGLSPREYFTLNVKESQILVVVFKDMVRPGVLQEIKVALRGKKTILAYFFKGKSETKEIAELKKLYHNSFTFNQFENFENLDEIIFNDVVQSIIFKFKTQKIHNVSDNFGETFYEVDDLITKNVLDLFQNCYGFTSHYFGFNQKFIENNTKFDIIGMNFLLWVFTGKKFISKTELEELEKSMKLLFNDSNWISHKFYALYYFFELNDTKNAL